MPGPHQLRCAPFGAPLLITSGSRAFCDAAGETVAQYPDLGLRAPLHMDVAVHDDVPGDPAWPVITADDGPDVLIVRCGSAAVRLRHADGAISATLPRSLCAVPDALRLLVESVVTSFHVRGGRLHAVHSALVVRDGVGLLLRGPSGAGKSTLTYAAHRRGMTMVSDDWLYAPAHVRADQLAGYPWRIMLTESAAARFPELADVPVVPHTSEERHKVRVTPDPSRRSVVGAVHAVVLLDPDAELSLVQVDRTEAAARFWGAALPSERAHLTDAWVDELLDRPTFVLRRGTDPDVAAGLLDDLAQRLATRR